MYIPFWIKITASWWADEKISDQDFVVTLQYLIENQILVIPETEIIFGPGCVPGTSFDILEGICKIPEPAPAGIFPTSFDAHQKTILSWIKITASWWADEKISDQDFVVTLQYLIENQILVIPETETTKPIQVASEPQIQPKIVPKTEIPFVNIDRIEGFRVHGHPSADSYNLQFRLISVNGIQIAVDGTVSISIMDDRNRILYLDGFSVRKSDFTTSYETFSGKELLVYSWEIPVSDVERGFGSLGTVNLVFTDRMNNSYSNRFDGISIPQFN